MLGFLIGTVCLIGLIKTIRRGGPWGRWHGHGGCGGWAGHGGGCADAGCGGGWAGHHHGEGRHGPPWARGGFGQRFFLRALFERLDTTPGQEKVIVGAIDELRETAQKHREELRQTRADVARVMRGPAVDETLLGDVFARHDSAMDAMRKAFVGAMAKVHDALDEKQRAKLADLVESGPSAFRGGFGGPYRQWV